MGDHDLLVEMGFDPAKATLALKKSGNLDSALQWLDTNADKSVAELEAESAASTSAAGTVDSGDGEQPEIAGTAASLRCEECGKLFSSTARAEFHAARTQHDKFAESTEKIEPLSEEQKAAKLAELKVRLAEKREAERVASITENKKNELIRRKHTQEGSQMVEDLKKKEQLKEIEKRKREKEDDRIAKQRVRDKIRETQEARKKAAEDAKAKREGRAVAEAEAVAEKQQEKPVEKKTVNHTESRLQLRCPGGQPLIKTFAAETTLFEVAAEVERERGFAPETFTMTFPRKIFSRQGGADFGMTLKEAGMVPSCALLVN